jgi:glutamate synthase domain-containing protein 1
MNYECGWDMGMHNPSGCGITSLMSTKKHLFRGSLVVKSLDNMVERGNGLGAGYAGYGIYPEHAKYYALHLMFTDQDAKKFTEEYLGNYFKTAHNEPIPTKAMPDIKTSPIFHRYFVLPKQEALHVDASEAAADEFVVRRVTEINSNIKGAFVTSSGKNMGVFKGVGYPNDIGGFFKLDEYQGYCWIGHSRFPTNTPGWWGGAHPFTMLDTAIVHNGEISSYGINRRYIEMFGYRCTMMTDSEAIAYLFDFLHRKQRVPMELIPAIFSSEFWQNIDVMDEEHKKLHETIRQVYGAALLNGPFAIVVGHRNGMFGLSDRVKLRPMIAAKKDDVLYIASEEAGIREICPKPDSVWMPRGGEMVAGYYEEAKK